MNRDKKDSFLFVFVVLLSICFLYCSFANLESMAVNNWDEARHGIIAYEMIQRNNWIENTFNYEKDVWNLKPPLSFWMEAVSMKIFGFNTFAARFPSAIAFTIMFFGICVFLKRNYGLLSTLTFMLLFCAFDDFFFWHLGRRADADALYDLFFAYSFIFLHSYGTKKKKHYLYLSLLFAAFAFLTKSFHAIVIYLLIIVYIAIIGEWKKISFIEFVGAVICAFGPVIVWVLLRYHYDGTEFLTSMFSTDVTERVNRADKDVFDYIKWICNILFSWVPRAYLLLLGSSTFVVLFEAKDKKLSRAGGEQQKHIIWLWVVSCIILFGVYAIAFSRFNWYFYPFLILLCMLTSIVFQEAVKTCKYIFNKKRKLFSIVCVAAMMIWITCFGYSALNVFRNLRRASAPETEQSEIALKTLVGRDSIYSGKNSYIVKPETEYGLDNEWEQADILVAELYNDFHCKNGGVEAFLTENQAVLILPKSIYSEYVELEQSSEIIAANDTYMALGRVSKGTEE